MGLLDGWRLCPRCGHELEPREHGHLGCPSCGSEYYANSAPAVQGVLERDGRVLLAKRAIEPRLGYWDLPGGFLEEGEEPLDGLRREFREETGLEVEPVEWLGAFLDPYNRYFVLGLTWVVHAEGEPRAADDVAELRWFAPGRAAGRDGVREPGARARAWADARRRGTATRVTRLLRSSEIRATRRGERMDERGTFHVIEDDLAEGWVDEWWRAGWRRSRSTSPSTSRSSPTSKTPPRSVRAPRRSKGRPCLPLHARAALSGSRATRLR